MYTIGTLFDTPPEPLAATAREQDQADHSQEFRATASAAPALSESPRRSHLCLNRPVTVGVGIEVLL